MKRLLLITEIIAPYRIPVFNELACITDIDLQVLFLSETDLTLRDWRVYKNEIKFEYRVMRSRRFRVGRHMLLLNHGLVRELKTFAPDVIICGGYNYPASWQALFWATRNRVPFVLWCESNANDLRTEVFPIAKAKRRFISRCSGFAVPGKASFEYLRSMGISGSVIDVAPNAVDVEFFARNAKAARHNAKALRQRLQLPEKYLLFVGRLVAEKGVFDLLNAFTSLKSEIRKDLALVFVGSGEERTTLEKLASKIQPGLVKFAGFVQKEELPAYYALAEAFVLPTHSDPWGLVVNEAMACGLPVIISDVAGCAKDLVRDGWNGFVVRQGDVAGLACAIEKLTCDRDLQAAFRIHSSQLSQFFLPFNCAVGLAAAAGIVPARDSQYKVIPEEVNRA